MVATLQLGIAVTITNYPWWVILAAAYFIGAVLALALWVLLHETTHDLVLRTKSGNEWLGILSGLPLIIPAAASFRKFHLLHHRRQGDAVLDGDVPSPWEVQIVGNSWVRKAFWLLLAPLMLCLRPARMRAIQMLDYWLVVNVALQVCFNLALILFAGWGALAYCLLANIFALGLHPLGGRWIQEHFPLSEGQETYSYYGIMNRLVFNAGYHVEHHDLMRISWRHLPTVRRLAADQYNDLVSYNSWGRLLIKFIVDRDVVLGSRGGERTSDQKPPSAGTGELQPSGVTPSLET
ncbi:fatty acid desaturase [Sphingorhabdus sp.]|uniref:fatty acid desaturase n=1 Tax=Sphingorhabdus sp. TaxID=1902408 RepID=UPI003918769A